jgi:DnaJ-class molecular chaperone
MTEDFYKILEVPKDATEQDIKKAYRKLTMDYHPDRNKSPEAEEKIRKINEAYEIIGDKKKRQQYDAQSSGGFPGGFPGGFHNMGGGAQDMFNMFFGGGGAGFHVFHNGASMQMKPPPMQQIAMISLEQCFHGCEFQVRIERTIVGADNRMSKESDTINVTIPPGSGSSDNEVFILKEKGNIVRDIKGDVQIILRIENNTCFGREGLDLIYKKTISLKEALCGFSFTLKHLNGETMTFENKTKHNIISPNYKMIRPNLGLIREGHGNGKLIIDFTVAFPTSLTPEQIESLSKIL